MRINLRVLLLGIAFFAIGILPLWCLHTSTQASDTELPSPAVKITTTPSPTPRPMLTGTAPVVVMEPPLASSTTYFMNTADAIAVEGPPLITAFTPPSTLVISGSGGTITVHFDTGAVDVQGATLPESGRLFWHEVTEAFPDLKRVVRAQVAKEMRAEIVKDILLDEQIDQTLKRIEDNERP